MNDWVMPHGGTPDWQITLTTAGLSDEEKDAVFTAVADVVPESADVDVSAGPVATAVPTTDGWVSCCPHCGCGPDERVGHDDTCKHGCNDERGAAVPDPLLPGLQAAREALNDLGLDATAVIDRLISAMPTDPPERGEHSATAVPAMNSGSDHLYGWTTGNLRAHLGHDHGVLTGAVDHHDDLTRQHFALHADDGGR